MSLTHLQYELMLFSRNYLKPHHSKERVLDRSAYVLLSRLEFSEPMTLKEISEALGLDASTIHRQSSSLFKAAHLEHVAPVSGQVARRVRPTAAGLAALAETRRIFEQGLASVVDTWPADKQEHFQSLLRDFNERVEALEGTSWPRPYDGENRFRFSAHPTRESH